MQATEHNVSCPYCGREADFVAGSAQFYSGVDYGPVWACDPCDARVGCHRGTTMPLGRLANRELRRWKSRAHKAFDPLWKTKAMSRSKAYGLLANALGIHKSACHIGMFDVDLCRRTVDFAQEAANA